jgi:hypothetical protein
MTARARRRRDHLPTSDLGDRSSPPAVRAVSTALGAAAGHSDLKRPASTRADAWMGLIARRRRPTHPREDRYLRCRGITAPTSRQAQGPLMEPIRLCRRVPRPHRPTLPAGRRYQGGEHQGELARRQRHARPAPGPLAFEKQPHAK